MIPCFFNLSALLLSPLLLAQGLHTRRRTPKLPEPPGPRQGVAGSGEPLRLLIIGDSAAAGVGAGDQREALSGQLSDRLAERFRVEWLLHAETGATTESTIASIGQLEPKPHDVALTSLGVNDVTSGVGLDKWLGQQRVLRELLKERFGVSLVVHSGLPPMHGFPALPQPLRWYLGSRATRFDRALEAELADHPYARFLSLRFTVDPAHIATDGFHPGPPVYREWARRAAELIINCWSDGHIAPTTRRMRHAN